MPNGIYPVPRFHTSPERRRHGILLRLLLARHRTELDEQLAAGAQPVAGTLLYHRAEELGSRKERSRLAQGLADALSEAYRARPRYDARIPLRTREVRECDEDIFALIRRLQDERPIDVQGAAMTQRLLADPSGPLARAGEVSVRYAVRSARLALDHADDASVAVPEAA